MSLHRRKWNQNEDDEQYIDRRYTLVLDTIYNSSLQNKIIRVTLLH